MTVRESWRTGLRAELRADRLLPAVIAGVLLGFIEVIVAISLGSLVFSGDLALYLPRGIGIALITSVVSMLVIALRTSAPGILGSIQDTPVVLMAVIGGTLVGSMAADDPALLPTVLVAIASISILTGGFLWALGMFNLGKLTRYIPYPVIGGFLAATGWLLAQGSIGTMAGYELTLDTLPDLLKSDQLILWGPGVAFGLTLFFGLRYITHDLTLPGLLVGAFLVFFAVLLITGTSIDEATDKGLLLGDSGSAASWKLLAPSDWIDADWSAILGQSANIGAILALSAVGLLLNASGLELLFKQDMDLNRELRAAGLANVLTGAAGGMVGYPTLSLTRLSHRVGGRGRLPGIAAAGVCAVMLFAGTSILAYFPVMILGGLLLFLGLDFLDEWAIRGYRKFNRLDYGVVLLILGVIATTDFLTGVGVGLVVMVILFVLQYTRIDVVRHALTGAEIHSNMERSAHHRRALAEMGDHVYMLELQGYIFFGTANALLERVRARLDDPDRLPLRFLVLDFRRVSGLDSSSVLSFGKIRLLADQRDFVLVLTHLAPAMQRQFDRDGLAASS
ncbi:MAG: SulP family inorganic anion transporter, partial [Anaerolineae bacterium]|nr:SulP family inorganic anion transporter [Anaerolineae bacterium]